MREILVGPLLRSTDGSHSRQGQYSITFSQTPGWRLATPHTMAEYENSLPVRKTSPPITGDMKERARDRMSGALWNVTQLRHGNINGRAIRIMSINGTSSLASIHPTRQTHELSAVSFRYLAHGCGRIGLCNQLPNRFGDISRLPSIFLSAETTQD
jgi:hypothetical protein